MSFGIKLCVIKHHVVCHVCMDLLKALLMELSDLARKPSFCCERALLMKLGKITTFITVRKKSALFVALYYNLKNVVITLYRNIKVDDRPEMSFCLKTDRERERGRQGGRERTREHPPILP